MRLPIIPLAILILLVLCVDAYMYLAAKRRCRTVVPAKIQLYSALLIYVALGVTLCLPMRSGDSSMLRLKMWLLFGFLTIEIPKILFVIIDLVASVPRAFHGKRNKWISLVGGILSVVLFGALWWGALINRYSIDVNSVEIKMPILPRAFDGYRIVQISDLHVGTYGNDESFVNSLVNKVNSLEPDLIVFTGDILNRRTDEILPFVGSLSELYAPDGVISILGNHDYGDYYNWDSDAEKNKSLELLKTIQKDMGWNLLLNGYHTIRRGSAEIVVIGVENIGDPPFAVYGDLVKSYPDLSDTKTKILLTHNPAHWDTEVANKDSVNIALTLSGHTHAMQVELLGLSPAAWRYKQWGGLYKDEYGRHSLYVNIGAGTVGVPMRLGATPEITLITLRR